MSEAIRLVIWDLDETFWKGTLTEGGIQYVNGHHDIVIALAKRGIISSICSKNNFSDVEDVLQRYGLWDYFVFPSIDWSAKGTRVAGIIKAAQLRPQSVLFIDDNPLNRNEALAAIPGLRACDESVIGSLLSDPLLMGKDDPSSSRLKEYKILEQKSAALVSSGDNNIAFLRSSKIKVEITYDLHEHLDRAVELINRTNQLNFTKRRLPTNIEDARRTLLEEMGSDFTRRPGYVKVTDQFGDYGIVGFFVIEGLGYQRARALHFCFSCRTLGMGVEQWVYDKLGRPDIEIVGEVVSKLDFVPDWINCEQASGGGEQSSALSGANVLIRGGCETEILAHFFGFHTKSVRSELIFYDGIHSYWLNHIANFRSERDVGFAVYAEEMSKLGYNAASFGTLLDDENQASCIDLVVMTLSGDYAVPTYKNKAHGFLFATYVYNLNPFLFVETEENVEQFIQASGLDAVEREKLYKLYNGIKSNFDIMHIHELDYDKLYNDALSVIENNKLVIVILPPERRHHEDGSTSSLDGSIWRNDIWRRVAARRNNLRLIETEALINKYSDLLEGSIWHYSRDVNYKIFLLIEKAYEEWCRVAVDADRLLPVA